MCIDHVASKCTVVNPWHWLNEDGSFLDDSRIRNRSIRVAQCIEYGGPLGIGETRETLITCRLRPGGKSCPGLLWVLKQTDDAILAFCTACKEDEFLIYEWEDTPWANGPMEPVHVEMLAEPASGPSPKPQAPDPSNVAQRLEQALAVIGSSMDAREVRARLADAAHPMAVIDAIFETMDEPPTRGALERFMPVLMEAWNETPRPEFAGRSPEQVHRDTTPVRRETPKTGRNAPCPCGSGKKYKRCCGAADRLH